MGKISDLAAFDHEQIVGACRMDHSVSEIVRELEFSRSTVSRAYRQHATGGKNCDRVSCKGQSVLNECGVIWLNRIVRSQRHYLKLPPSWILVPVALALID